MNVLTLFKPIRVFVFDVDGVMTDGTLQLLENGELSRKMHIRDGYALQLAIKKNYRILVISGGNSATVIKRLHALGIEDVFMGVIDKKKEFVTYLEKHSLDAQTVLYMGDDMPDCEVMKQVGLPVCPVDAVQEIKKVCHYISPFKGGEGCVRDVIEKVLRLNGDWKD